MMLAHVLVPLDGSHLAQSALNYALQMLEPNGKITLVTVLQNPEVPIYDFYPVTVAAQIKDYDSSFAEALSRASYYLKHVANDINARYPFEVNIEVEVGDPANVIVESAESLHVDAIIMSTHGRSGLSRWLFGSVTQKVLTAACCPVFVIPARACEDSKSVTPEEVEAHPA